MILTLDEIEEKLQMFKDKKKVLVGGCFDVLHYGHLKFLQEAKKLGEVLIVALEPDEFILKKKGRKPIHNQTQRAEILDNLKIVDVVIKLPVLKGYTQYLKMANKVKPQFIAATKGDPQAENKKKIAKNIRAEYKEIIKRIEPFSTSSILKNEAFHRN